MLFQQLFTVTGTRGMRMWLFLCFWFLSCVVERLHSELEVVSKI